MPDPKDNKKESNNTDWFIGRMNGELSGNYADIASDNEINKKEFDFKTKEEYWNNEDIKTLFESEYGDNAQEEFDKVYEAVSEDYNTFVQGKYDVLQTNEVTVRKGLGGLSRHKERKDTFDQGVEWKTYSGAQELLGSVSRPKYDPRKTNIDSKIVIDSQGDKHTWEYKDGVYYIDGIPSDEFRDAAGNEIHGFAYDPNTLDPLARGEGHLLAITDGKFKDTAGLETASHWDLIGWSDPKLESTAATTLAAIPKSVWNGVASLFEGFASLGASLAALAGSEDIKNTLEEWVTNAKSAQISKSKSAQEDFWDKESLVSTLTDIVVQIAIGRGAGLFAMKSAAYLGTLANASRGAIQAASVKSAKIASSALMTVYGGKDMYEESLANGFSEKEAATLHLAGLAALFAANRASSFLDKEFEGIQMINEHRKLIKKNLAYFKPGTINNPNSKSIVEDAVTGPAKLFSIKMKNGLVKASEYLKNTKYGTAMVQESIEEMLEHVSEESVKQFANMYVASGLAGREYGDQGEGRFKDIFDEGYWEEFGEGLLISGSLGAVGGGIANIKLGKKFFNKGPKTAEEKQSLLNTILSGQGPEYLAQLETLRMKGVLGPEDLSIQPISKGDNKGFVPMSQLKDDASALSMNEANYRILLQEYNYVNSVVKQLGAVDAYKNYLKKHGEDGTDIISLAKDIRNDINKYFEILQKNDEEHVNLIEPFKPDSTQEERDEQVKKQAKLGELDEETVREIAQIKTNLEEVNSGRAAEKYYIKLLAKDSILDPEHKDYQKNFGKFGDDFFHNLMKSSYNSSVENKLKAEQIQEKIKDNDKVLNTLDKDLSNLDEVLSSIRSGNDLFLSDKAKDKINKLANDFTIPQQTLDNLKNTINLLKK